MKSLESTRAISAIDATTKVGRKGMTRRGLLQTLAGGLGAGLLATRAKANTPPPAAPLTELAAGQSPETVWSTMLNISPAAGYQPMYYRGIAALVYAGNPGANGTGGYVYAMDVHSGATNESVPFPDGAQLGPGVGYNEFILSPGSDGSICAVNPYQFLNIGLLIPPEEVVSNLLVWNNLVLFVGSSGDLMAVQVGSLDGQQGITPVWQAPTKAKSLSGTWLVQGGSGQIMIFTNYDVICMNVSQQGASLAWGITTPDPHYSKRATTDGNYVYILTQQHVTAYSAIDGSAVGWTVPLKNVPPSPALAYNGFLYFTDPSGNLNAIDVVKGQMAWQVTLPGPLGEDLFIEDGIAYTSCSSEGLIFAVELDTQGAEFLQYKAPQGFAQIAGVENGLCIVLYSNTVPGGSASVYYIAGIDMATQLHGFFCESRLMPDNQSVNQTPNSPTYRTRLLLVDPNKNPRAFKSVKVWSSAAVTITSGGANYNIDNNGNAAWLQTDATGEIDVTCVAGDISNPALYVWGSFMDRQEAIVIYPDYQTSQDIHSSTPATVSAATTYSGAALLPGGVTASQVVTTIQNTIGGGVSSGVSSPAMQSVAVARARWAADQIRARKRQGRKRLLGTMASDTYMAYPSSSPNMLYQQVAAIANRPFLGAGAQNFTATFSPTGGLNVGPWQQPPVSAATNGLLGFSFGDLVNDVTKGADAIAKLTVTIANDAASAAHYIETAAGKVFNLVVQSFEDAITTLGAFFKSVLGSIEKAVEWLSYLFDWATIKEYKEQIAATLNQLAGPSGAFQDMVNSVIQPGLATLHADFQKAENAITSAITSIQQQIGGMTTQSIQQSKTNNNDPTAIFSGGSYSQSGMIKSKLTQNASQATITTGALTADPTNLTTLWKQLSTDVTSAVGSISSDLSAQGQVFQSAFNQLLVNPTKFVQQSFGAILNILLEVAKDLAKLILQATDLAIELLVNSLIQFVNGILSLLTQQVHIPVLSDIFGGSMSFVDLISWIVAVPVAIISKAGGLNSSSGTQLVGSTTFLERATLIAGIFGAIVDATADGVGAQPNDFLGLTDLGFGTLSWILNVVTSVPVTVDAPEVGIFLGLQTIPLIISGVAAAVATWDEEDSPAISKVTPTLDFYYGGLMGVISMWWGFSYPEKFSNPNYMTLAENLINSFAYQIKQGVNGGPIAKAIVVISDFVLPTTADSLALAIDNAS